MKDIKHIFFDLDHTLWDYDKSAGETLVEIYDLFQLRAQDVTTNEFVETFYTVNNQLWHRYNHGEVDRTYIKEHRFREIFTKLDVDLDFSLEASSYFLNHCSTKPYLLPDSLTALNYLQDKYQLHIITNGFLDSQTNKLNHSGLMDFFDVIVTSECTGAKKPAESIFHYSLEKANAEISNSVMIGDNPRTDISGAKKIGMLTVLYDPSGRKRSLADFSIQSHLELIRLF